MLKCFCLFVCLHFSSHSTVHLVLFFCFLTYFYIFALFSLLCSSMLHPDLLLANPVLLSSRSSFPQLTMGELPWGLQSQPVSHSLSSPPSCAPLCCILCCILCAASCTTSQGLCCHTRPVFLYFTALC